jgi:hypothetical protein
LKPVLDQGCTSHGLRVSNSKGVGRQHWMDLIAPSLGVRQRSLLPDSVHLPLPIGNVKADTSSRQVQPTEFARLSGVASSFLGPDWVSTVAGWQELGIDGETRCEDHLSEVLLYRVLCGGGTSHLIVDQSSKRQFSNSLSSILLFLALRSYKGRSAFLGVRLPWHRKIQAAGAQLGVAMIVIVTVTKLVGAKDCIP